MDTAVTIAMAIGLVALYPGWMMSQKGYFLCYWKIPGVMVLVLLPMLIAGGFFYLPFWIASGSEIEAFSAFIDFTLYSICPLCLIAIIAYVMDNLFETPTRAIIAGSCCFAVFLLPVLYYFLAEQMHASLDITIK